MPSPRPGTRAADDGRAAAAKGGTTPGKPRRSWPRRILLALGGAFLLGVIGLVVVYVLTPIPKANEAAVAQASIVYYADGTTEMGRFGDVNRESVALAKVPRAVQQAFLAAEDRDFYTNSGISPTGIGRAVWTAIRGGQTQGGSTITQQYVKNYYLSQDQTLTRKLKEIMISLKVDRQLTKSDILESYLNTIYFGRGASGIQAASKAYFGKDVSKLTVSEGALLASVIRGPSFYDPALGDEQRKLAQGRWTYVVDGMVTQGWITAPQRAALAFPRTQAPRQRIGVSGPDGYVVAAVRQDLLTQQKLTDAEIDAGGLRIVTTIDRKKQVAAVNAVRDRLPKDPANLHPALVSITPGDGAIVAMYAGADFQKRQFNDATQGMVQAGSTFKIFGLIAALQSGDIGTNARFSGASPQFFTEFRDANASTDFLREGGVRNFGGEGYGRLNLIDATANSVNTIYAQVNIEATPKATAQVAATAGITTKLTPVYANILGTDNVKVIDMANAYATIAANGKRATPYLVRKVTSTSSDYTYAAKPVTKQVFDPDVMSDVMEAMQAVVERGSGSFAGDNLDRPAAGKTGTTTGNFGAWFDGFTPNLATAVGIYRGDGDSSKEANAMSDIPGVGQLTGATVPVRIWTDYMKVALEGMKVVEFPEPKHVNWDKAPTPTSTPPPATSSSSSSTSTTTTSTTTTSTTDDDDHHDDDDAAPDDDEDAGQADGHDPDDASDGHRPAADDERDRGGDRDRRHRPGDGRRVACPRDEHRRPRRRRRWAGAAFASAVVRRARLAARPALDDPDAGGGPPACLLRRARLEQPGAVLAGVLLGPADPVPGRSALGWADRLPRR